MRLQKRLLLGGLMLFFAVTNSFAVPAYPFPVKITQKDGTTLTIIKKGNPHFHYDITEDGVLIKKDSQGIYRYATLDKSGQIVITQQKAQDKVSRSNEERKFVSTLQTISSPESFIKKAEQKRVHAFNASLPKRNFPKVGSPKSVVILVNFANLDFVVDNAQDAFSKLLNEKGYSKNGGTGSARDYFVDNSMGVFSPDFDVLGPYTLPNNYEFYGANDTNGDVNAPQMIVDACKLADDAGVDFSQYDTDNDGLIDNVFVYYAGYNEAEHGGENTVWPHRWVVMPGQNYTGTEQSATFDGKRVLDYACTSELKGSGGSTMCGIGTFAHEFGHVLGLADMYPTRGQNHHTLYTWDIMDLGPYLNKGRTPPAYNAFQRFRLGFMTPTILDKSQSFELEPINTSNKAFLIVNGDKHNLNGMNPSPKEFFLIENRQRTGWDAYLPGHGMLVFRINYNSSTWNNNTPNNDPDAMGVDLMEADEIASRATLSGDPFPGTSYVTKYKPKLRSKKVLENNSILGIQEKNGIISFTYGRRPVYVEPPINLKAKDITYKDFVVSWDKVKDDDKDAAGYYVSLFLKNSNGTDSIVLDNKGWTTNTMYKFPGVLSNREYEVKVRASDKNVLVGYENITAYSKSLLVRTLPYPFEKELRCTVNRGKVKIFVPRTMPEEEGKAVLVDVFDMLGKRIYSTSTTEDILEISNLPRNIVLIVKSNKQHKKIVII